MQSIYSNNRMAAHTPKPIHMHGAPSKANHRHAKLPSVPIHRDDIYTHSGSAISQITKKNSNTKRCLSQPLRPSHLPPSASSSVESHKTEQYQCEYIAGKLPALKILLLYDLWYIFMLFRIFVFVFVCIMIFLPKCMYRMVCGRRRRRGRRGGKTWRLWLLCFSSSFVSSAISGGMRECFPIADKRCDLQWISNIYSHSNTSSSYPSMISCIQQQQQPKRRTHLAIARNLLRDLFCNGMTLH